MFSLDIFFNFSNPCLLVLRGFSINTWQPLSTALIAVSKCKFVSFATKQKSNLLGCSHLALGVDNIDKVCDQIKKNGGSIVNTPALNDLKNAKVAYCHDNEGNLLEIVEIL